MLAPKIVILKGETHHNVSLFVVDFVFQALIDKKPQNITANLLVNCHFWQVIMMIGPETSERKFNDESLPSFTSSAVTWVRRKTIFHYLIFVWVSLKIFLQYTTEKKADEK